MKIRDKQFAVIGLGRFGLSVCQELAEAATQFVTQAVVANCTLEDTAEELKLSDYDMVMISIGEDVNASILTTLVMKEAGVKSVWVKANDKFHATLP